MRTLLRFSFVFLLCLYSSVAFATATSDQGPYRIHMITIGQGEEIFTRFGHIALMVENTATEQKDVYNFGQFNFDDPDLRLKYAKGFLNYWLAVAPFDLFIAHYAQTDREMWIQTLNLSDTQAKKVADKLVINAKPENRYYMYRHFLDNCCTRIRDVIDEATNGALSKKFKEQSVDRDFRYWTSACLEGLPLYKSVILYSLGPAVDQPLTRWDEQFLPSVLLEDLDKVTVGPSQMPLVQSRRALLSRSGPAIGATIPKIDKIVIGLLGLFVLLGFVVPMLFGNRSWCRRLLGIGLIFWGLLAGLGGLMLLLYWAITTHYDTHYNENLLIFPLFHLWLVGPGVALLFVARLRPLTKKIIRYCFLLALSIIGIVILLKVGPFIQGNWGVIGLSIFLNSAGLVALKRTGVLSRILPRRRTANKSA